MRHPRKECVLSEPLVIIIFFFCSVYLLLLVAGCADVSVTRQNSLYSLSVSNLKMSVYAAADGPKGKKGNAIFDYNAMPVFLHRS